MLLFVLGLVIGALLGITITIYGNKIDIRYW